ncbi:MAG: spermidine synthase [Rhodospirillaceae bacterium]
MPRLKNALVALTIFLGAFLLFAVEPLIAKMILPWFGGSEGVWIACLLFFQAALLAGYFYAHVLTHRLSPAHQWRLHVVLLGLSLLLLPIIPADHWKPDGAGEPLFRILALLAATIGLPFMLLAATGPLMQSWFARNQENTPSVYRLYALSNVASLLALLSYPVLIEPWLASRTQAWSWSAAYVLFALSSVVVAAHYRHAETAAADAGVPARPADRLLWFALAAVPSLLLLAATNHMLRNIAAIPLLWIMPLALYLLSFIICFDHPRWYYRPLWYGLLPIAIGTMILSTVAPFLVIDYILQIAIYAGAFFICCMICHGELAAQKPAPRHLTSFYLIIAGGGVAGGLLVAAVAPMVFDYDHDLPIAMALFTALIGFVAWRRWPPGIPSWVRWNGLLVAPTAGIMLIGIVVAPPQVPGIETVLAERNFYGPLLVTTRRMNVAGDIVMELQNGSIMHGREYMAPGKQCEPLSYYARTSGVGVALQELAKTGGLKIGVIGLGAGSIAGYARDSDTLRFYEINPLVAGIAANTFHYLPCAAHHSVEMGDARLTLEREAPNNFDLLAVDAFTGDAIPVHLLTREAFDLYWRHLKPGGVLAVHVSNTFIDLAPVVAAIAAQGGKSARAIAAFADEDAGVSHSIWMLVADDPAFFDRPAIVDTLNVADIAPGRAWTDGYSDLWHSLRW